MHSDDDLVLFDDDLAFLIDENGVPQSIDPESVIFLPDIQNFKIKVIQTELSH